MSSPMPHLSALLRRFARDERGVFAVLFGLMAIVLVAMGGAVVDYVTLEQTRNRSQVALDAAALALQQEIGKLQKSDIQERAQNLVDDRVGIVGLVEIEDTVIDQTAGSLYFRADMTVDTAFVRLVGVPTLSARIHSEVKRGSLDIEVAVAVDITGSMTDPIRISPTGWRTEQKIVSLRRALGELIDLVVQDEQEPSHSKMAIVPYSMGVNVGDYAGTLRGAVKMPTPITSIGWSTGGAVTISGATKGNPVVVTTSTKHGFQEGDFVYITSPSRMTDINNRAFRIKGVTDTTFQLTYLSGTNYVNLNGSGFGTYSGTSGRVTKCLVQECELVVQSPNHGLASNAQVHIYGVEGMLSYSDNSDYDSYRQYPTTNSSNYYWINNNRATYSGTLNDERFQYKFLVWDIGAANQDTFVLKGTSRTNGKDYRTYTRGGFAACVTAGCKYYLYQNRNNAYNSWRLQEISTCVTERSTQTYTDVPTSSALMGRNYPTDANPCPNVGLQPLTDNKVALHDLADDLPAVGSTAGHIGIAMAWNMVSPNFQGPWPSLSQPVPKTHRNVLRAVVLMTDGAFNTSYCNGVISQQSGDGSGNLENKINCNSPNNDNSFDQAKKLCAAMKAADPAIRIYTVAFDVGNIAAAKEVMDGCATEPAMAYQATTGAGLDSVFKDIGENLSYLRITR